MAYFVSGVEFVGGILAGRGVPFEPRLPRFIGRYACRHPEQRKLSAMPKGLSPLNWLDALLYLPEVLYVLFFIWLICSGPGRFSRRFLARRQC